MHEMEVFLILDNLDGKKSFSVDNFTLFWPQLEHFKFFVL